MSKWIGYAVSVNCGEPLGCYQGTILEADGNTITLTKAFRNGFPYPKSQVTLNAADIKQLKIIEERAAPAAGAPTHSTVAVAKAAKKPQRATVCETLQANPSSSGGGAGGGRAQSARTGGGGGGGAGPGPGGGTTPARSKPIDIQGPRNAKTTHSTNTGSYGNSGSTPGKARQGAGGPGGGPGGGGGGGGGGLSRRRNEACFGAAADPPQADFDFEGNLALFDKRALWDQINQKPDLVRQTDEVGKYRHDENVLGGDGCAAAGNARARRAIRVPDELRGPLDYVTDDGLCVPSATPRLRTLLWEGMQRYGLVECAWTLLARGTADVALRLVGGGRRLEARNAHQAPRVAVLAAPRGPGVAGLITARLLAAHGVTVTAYLDPPGSTNTCSAVQRETGALAAAGVALVEELAALGRPDLVVVALHSPLATDQHPHQPWGADQHPHSEAISWARGARAPVVALEPPSGGWAGLTARAAVTALLPAALAPSLGRVYLCCVAAPAALFADLRLAYRPPFGAATLLALHPSDE